MISLPDLLRRLRRAWAPPGPALARMAPPTDVAARLEAEIRPLLAAIAELQRSAGTVRGAAESEAAGIAEAAGREAEHIVREAEKRAPVKRAEAARRRNEAVNEEIEKLLAAADAEVTRIDAAAKSRLPELADRVTACVLSGAGIEL